MINLLRHPFRVLFRGTTFVFLILIAIGGHLLSIALRERSSPDYLRRSAWAHRLARRLLRVLFIHPTFHGQAPLAGVLVCNHLSYLDVLVLTAAQPMVFISKSEVRGWPLIGWAVSCAGTLFINRRKRSDVQELASAMAGVLEQPGLVLAFFPEGTSSGGEDVLPFHPSLLEPAVARNWPVTPAGIRYTLREGSVPDEIAYWRDMTFLPHFLNVLTKRRIEAHVAFGPPLPIDLDRKGLALTAREAVRRLTRET